MCFQDTKSVVKVAKTAKRFKVETKDEIGKALNAFLNGDARSERFGRYVIDGDTLVYRVPTTTKLQLPVDALPNLIDMIKANAVVLIDPPLAELEKRVNDAHAAALRLRASATTWTKSEHIRIQIQCLKQDVIARRLSQPDGTMLYVGNSSALGLIGRSVAFGRESLNRSETEVQARLSRLIPMVPFSVFEQAKLDLGSMRIIARGPEETVTRDRDTGKRDKKTGAPIYETESVHFTGASLYQIGDTRFLFDIDRREIDKRIFNPFLVKLPEFATPRTIADAYDCLKPDEVKEAEAKGVKVPRQGEWFFLPVDQATAAMLDNAKSKETMRRVTLQAGPNRPNYAQGISIHNGKPVSGTRVAEWQDVQEHAVSYVTGKVEHSGREHAPLMLKGWYRAVPNTASESFTITGDID